VQIVAVHPFQRHRDDFKPKFSDNIYLCINVYFVKLLYTSGYGYAKSDESGSGSWIGSGMMNETRCEWDWKWNANGNGRRRSRSGSGELARSA